MKIAAQIECYTCMDGDPVGNIFNSNVCPEGWTINKNPCDDNRTHPSKNNISSNEKFTLKKISYKYKDVIKNIDINFKELNNSLPQKDSPNSFFDIYNNNFYDLKKRTHSILLNKSEDYIGEIINPREKEISNLKDELDRIQVQIDSLERFHPVFDNGSFLMDSEYNSSYQTGFGGISSGGLVRGPKYFIQSGKKRRITDSYKIWSKVKVKFGILDKLSDEEIIIFISKKGLDAIPSGPPIYQVRDINKTSFEVNTYQP